MQNPANLGQIQALVERIHAAGIKLVYEFTGAGSAALAWLHSVGGSSRTVLEATDRYAAASLAELLRGEPEKYVSAQTAQAMAGAAHLRALKLAGDANRCLGVGCTAAISTNYAKRGEHTVFVAVHDGTTLWTFGLTFRKGSRDRAAEETIVSLLVLRAIADAAGVEPAIDIELLEGETIQETLATQTDPLSGLLHATVRWLAVHPDGTTAPEEPVSGVILSGSFNPLHEGHVCLAEAAARLASRPAYYELAVVNADKPPLAIGEIQRRLAQFRGRGTVLLTRRPLFVGKAELFPGCDFAIGFDTAVRLLAPRYYGDLAGRDAALAAISSHSCRFIVAGRFSAGRFHPAAELQPPAGMERMFLKLDDFRCDVSSTSLREMP